MRSVYENRFWLFLLVLYLATLTNPGSTHPLDKPSLERAQECSPGTPLTASGLPEMDCSTLDVLIRHDRYSIGLLQQLLKQATRTELKVLIQKMLQEHQQEILKLNALRKSWYGQPLNP